MLVQDFLLSQTGDSAAALAALSEKYGIRAKVYEAEDLVVLNYDQIESPKYEPIVRECRSLVLRYSNFEVVSRSFDRFFNYGEGKNEVDFKTAVAYEKADGSLIGFYYIEHLDKWAFRTRGTAFAESELPSGRSFNDAIVECIGCSVEEFASNFKHLPTHPTFIFEFISPENRIVTRYQKPELVFLSVRMNCGIELVIDDVITEALSRFNVRPARFFPVTSVEEVNEAVKALENLEEGFVICDGNRKRCKIKSPAYLKAHHIRGEGLTAKRVIELICEHEDEEYLSVFEEDRAFFEPYQKSMTEFIALAEEKYESVKHLTDKKEYAMAVKDERYSAILFTAKNKHVTIIEAFNQSSVNHKVELIQWHYLNKTSNQG